MTEPTLGREIGRLVDEFFDRRGRDFREAAAACAAALARLRGRPWGRAIRMSAMCVAR